jgi:protein O-mannosyl-transferase
MDQPAPSSHRHTCWLIAGALAALVLAAFWPVATFDFINYDDNRYLTANPIVQRGWSAEAWAYSWRSLDGGYWHPLTWWSHLIDTTLYGMDARGHHVTNLLIHLVNTLLLWWVLLRYTGAIWLSAWAAAIFAVHPMHVESVAWISERKDVLSGLFFLATLLAYRRYVEKPSVASYGLVTLALIAALLSKPMAVTIPAVLLLVDLWPLRRFGFRVSAAGVRNDDSGSSRNPEPKIRNPIHCILEKLPWFAMAIALGLFAITNAAAVGDLRASDVIPLSMRLQTMLIAYARYLGKLFWPAELSLFYPYPPAWPVAWVIGSVALLMTITALALWQLKRRPAIAVGWFWFLGVLLPISGIVLVSDASIAERYTYLPYIGLTIAIAWGLSHVPRHLLAAAGIVTVLACAVWASKNVWAWQNSLTIWERTLRLDPDNWTANYYYGWALADAGRDDEAGKYLARAVQLEPHVPMLSVNYARWLLSQGRMAEAETYAAMAGRVDPNDADFLSVAGRLEWHHGRPDSAAPLLARAAAQRTNLPEPRVYLGLSLIDLRALDEAERVLGEALQIAPNEPVALHGLARIAQRRGRLADAGQLYQRAIAASPSTVLPRLDYAEMAVDARAVQEAGGQLAAVDMLKASPLERARAELLRGRVLELIGRPMDAATSFLKSLELYREAIAADPADPRARYQLAVALEQTGQSDQALAATRDAISAAVAADHRVIQGQLKARFPAAATTQPTSR